MPKYTHIQTSTPFLSLPLDKPTLSILHRYSYTRIQQIMHSKQNYYLSQGDHYQTIRIIIFSLLSKIYHQYHEEYQTVLNKFQRIIYEGVLPSFITVDKGIYEVELKAVIAQKINDLEIGDSSQEYLCQFMNCQPFVDEILTLVIAQQILKHKNKYYSSEIKATQHSKQLTKQQICTWLYQTFSILLTITDSDISHQALDELYITIQKNHPMRQAYIQLQLIDTQSEQLKSLSQSNHIDKQTTLLLQETSLIQCSIIDMSQSNPSRVILAQNKNNIMINTVWKHYDENLRVNRKRKSFWSVLCCIQE